jgi:hypothetical protein
LKAAREKLDFIFSEQIIQMTPASHNKMWRLEGSGTMFQMLKDKNFLTYNSINHEIYIRNEKKARCYKIEKPMRIYHWQAYP